MTAASPLHLLLALLLAPLLLGVIHRVKALVAGRRGPPLLQVYYDVGKLLRRGAVYSRTTTWLFRAGPLVNLAAVGAALLLTPLGGVPAALAFPGDLFVAVYLLALGRFFTVLAALDTGSAFEGMGGSREVQFSALAEPAVLVALAVLARLTQGFSLSAMLPAVTPALWAAGGASLALLAVALFVVLLAENARIPFDDPNTHLELTMIHEVMVLDHGGPDFALITYGAALKLWLFAALLAGLVVPVRTGTLWLDAAAALGGVAAVGVAVGLVESCMARLRLVRVPQLLVSATVLAVLAFLLLVAR
jgi:formate hydrogenlyase subunit 4